MPRPELEQELEGIRYQLNGYNQFMNDPKNGYSSKEKVDKKTEIERNARPLIYKMALLKRAINEDSDISVKEIDKQAAEWKKTGVLDYIARRHGRYDTMVNFSGGNPSVNNPEAVVTMNENINSLLSWMDEYKGNEKYLKDFEKTDEAKKLKGKKLFDAKTRYIETRRAEDEFKRLNEELPEEKKLTGEKFEVAKEQFVSLWNINQAMKEVKYSYGLKPEKLFDLTQKGTKTKEELKIAIERQKMMDDWEAAVEKYNVGISVDKTIAVARSYFFLMDYSGTPEAIKKNEEIKNKLNSDDPKVRGAQRYELYKKAVDTILSLDDELLSPKNEAEAAKAWKENYPKFWLAFECEHLIAGMKSEVNVPDDIIKALKHKSALYQQNLSNYVDKFKKDANPDISKVEYVKEVGFENVLKAMASDFPHSIEPKDTNALLTAINADNKDKALKNDVYEIPDPEKYNGIKVGDRLEIINPDLKGPEAVKEEINISEAGKKEIENPEIFIPIKEGTNMRSKEEQERQAKQNLNLTDEEFALYKKYDKVETLWNEIVADNSLPENLAMLAGQFWNSALDVSDPQFVENLARYDRETGRISPLQLSIQELNKDGMVRFLTQLNSSLKPGDALLDFNLLADGKGYVRSFEKKLSNKNMEYFSTSTIIVNQKEGRLKPEIKKKTDAVKKVISKPEAKKRIDTLTGNLNIYRRVSDSIKKNKTGEERLEERFSEEKKKTEMLELAAGRSNKLLGRHKNYQLLTEIPLKKSDVLPMSGLALLVSNSLSINRNIADASTQYAQSFKAKPGVVLTEDEQKYLNQMTSASELQNVSAKIIESVLGGSDIERMGPRCTTIVEARKRLNLAAEEYEKGNKQPLVDLIKDSIPVIKPYAIDTCLNIDTCAGKALSEIVDAVETLFNNDPEIKEAVGMPEADLSKLRAVSRFTKQVVYPIERQKESFNKHMVPGSEDKNAYIKEMMYRSFLMSKLTKQVQTEINRVSELNSEILEKEVEKLSSKVTVEENGTILPEPTIISSLSLGITAKHKVDNTKWPEIYSIYEKEPVDESPLIEEFENSIVNTPEYKELLTQNADQLANANFESKLTEIYKANLKREQDMAMYQKRAAVLNVWDEVIHDYTLPNRLLYLADKFKETYVDVSDPGALSLLAQYNQETGRLESIPLKGHKDEPGYSSPTGFTHDKQGVVDFLFELDYMLSDATKGKELMNFNSTVRLGYSTVDSFRLDEKNEYSVNYFIPDSKKHQGSKLKQAADDFYESKKTDIKRLHDEYDVYSKVAINIRDNKTIDDKLNDQAEKEIQAKKTIDVISGRSRDLIGSHSSYRILSNLELEKVDGLPMQGLALLSANSMEVNKDVSDLSTQWPQEFVFKPGVTISDENEAFKRQMALTAECTNIGAKILDSVFSGNDVQRMGDRMPAVIEGRKKLNAAAKAYKDGDKKPLADLIKDSIPPVLSNAKIQTSMIKGSSGQAFIEMADSLKELFNKDAEMKVLVGIADKDLNKMYAAAAFVKKCVYPKQRQMESFRKYMAKGAENKEAYIKEMMYNSYLLKTLSNQVSDINTQVHKDINLMMDDAMKNHGDKIELSEKEKAAFGERRVLIDTAVRNSLIDNKTPWPEIYSVFERENGEAQLIKDFEDNIVNSPEYKELLEKSRDELGSMDFEKQLEGIYAANIERASQNKVSEVSNADINKELNEDDIAPLNMNEELKDRYTSPEEMQKAAVKRGKEIKQQKAAPKIRDNQIAPFTDEIARLSERLSKSEKDKQKNSMSYKGLKLTISGFASEINRARTVKELKNTLNSLNESADDYLRDHANDKKGIFYTSCGKGRRERIKTCARIKAMKTLFDRGIAYDSPKGKKIMLACKLVCAEKLERGFNGFKELCQEGAIKEAIKAKMKDPIFNIVADKALQNSKDYDKLTKMKGSDCLSVFNKAASKIEKAMGKDKNQVKEQVQKNGMKK